MIGILALGTARPWGSSPVSLRKGDSINLLTVRGMEPQGAPGRMPSTDRVLTQPWGWSPSGPRWGVPRTSRGSPGCGRAEAHPSASGGDRRGPGSLPARWAPCTGVSERGLPRGHRWPNKVSSCRASKTSLQKVNEHVSQGSPTPERERGCPAEEDLATGTAPLRLLVSGLSRSHRTVQEGPLNLIYPQ